MTDHTPIDSAERIRRLQERRAATSGTGNKLRRRRHPAAASRILLAGLSIASFFGIVGSMAATSAATGTEVAQPAATSRTKPSATPAQPGSSTGAAHTTTRGS